MYCGLQYVMDPEKRPSCRAWDRRRRLESVWGVYRVGVGALGRLGSG